MLIRLKMWPPERTQGFSKVCPSDLVFDLTCPIFEFVRDFNKTNTQTKFHDYQTENVASRAYTRQKVDVAHRTMCDARRMSDDRHSTITITHSLWSGEL